MLKHSIQGDVILIETDRLHARIRTSGYVSGIAAGSLVDKETESVDLGFGLHVADFLLESAAPAESNANEEQYVFGPGNVNHGAIAKRYVEGPQICTAAKQLEATVTEGAGFLVVRQKYVWTKGYGKYKPGSKWEQTIVFLEKERYFLSSDRIETVNATEGQFFRLDMPGHIKHDRGNTFEHVYLSYENTMLPSTDFLVDTPPDESLLYQRGKGPVPKRFIRAYQVKGKGAEDDAGATKAPWLAGITLNPADVYEAWCHQRGYVCMIEEIGGRPTKPGDSFGAAYAVGWFDSIREMEAVADKYAGWSGIAFDGPADRPTALRASNS